MRLIIKRCRICGARGIGLGSVKLYPFEDHLLCAKHWHELLQWSEQRETVIVGLGSELLRVAFGHIPEAKRAMFQKPKDWRGFIEELCGMAGFGLLHGDRRIFVYYSSRALWAWQLSKEDRDVQV